MILNFALVKLEFMSYSNGVDRKKNKQTLGEEMNIMEAEKTVTIPMRTAICAVRHFSYLHEGLCQSDECKKSLNCDWAWGIACYECSETECRGQWYEAMKPLFDAIGFYPRVARDRKNP